ncbi:MAG: hypothetical protein D4S01_11045 [Dehalococcoidia bacterium]|nr:MAG: hypothetical protein D4S01_11045 [Dehalococcoidia bacterium]
MKRVISLIAVVMLTTTLFACVPSPTPIQTPAPAPTPTPASAPEPSVIRITAVDLWEAYDENEVAADTMYRGKTLEISGIIDEIGKDLFDTPYINLRTKFSEIILPYPQDSLVMTESRVKCIFDSKHESQLAQLVKGQEVRVQGECSGYNYYVRMTDSTLLAATQIQKPENEEINFTVKIERSTLVPPRKIAGQEIPGSNIAVRIECSASEGIYIHTMALRSDIAEQTCYVGDTYGKGHVSGSNSYVYLNYQRPAIEVTLLGLSEEVLFHETITIED